MSKRTSYKALMTSFLSTVTLSLSVSLLIIGAAHAEQYCKSVDKDGNATYTLAPEKGCHATKMKTVAVSHHITPSTPITPVVQNPTDAKPTDVKPTDAKPVESKTNPTPEKSSPSVAAAPVVPAPSATPAR